MVVVVVVVMIVVESIAEENGLGEKREEGKWQGKGEGWVGVGRGKKTEVRGCRIKAFFIVYERSKWGEGANSFAYK